MRHPALRSAVAGGALLALAACASPSEEVSASSGTTSSPSAESTDEPSTASSGGAPTSASPRSSAGAPGVGVALDIQQRHPNGTLLRVFGITATATTTTVEIEAINGFTVKFSSTPGEFTSSTSSATPTTSSSHSRTPTWRYRRLGP